MLAQTQVDRVVPKFRRVREALSGFRRACERLSRRRASRVEGSRLQLARRAPAAPCSRGRSSVMAARCRPIAMRCERFRASGPYTAAAIRAFAFDLDDAPVDTNVRRVVHRLFFGLEYPAAKCIARDRRTRTRDRSAGQGPRLELGADGSRRDDLHGTRAEMPALPAAQRLRCRAGRC